jgi:hypothetical protein
MGWSFTMNKDCCWGTKKNNLLHQLAIKRAQWLQGRRSSVRLWSRVRRGRGDVWPGHGGGGAWPGHGGGSAWPGRGGGSAWPGHDGSSPTMKSIGKEIEKKIRKRESWVGPIGKRGLSSPCRPGGSIPRMTERIFHFESAVELVSHAIWV